MFLDIEQTGKCIGSDFTNIVFIIINVDTFSWTLFQQITENGDICKSFSSYETTMLAESSIECES